jgi:hypothetical protein
MPRGMFIAGVKEIHSISRHQPQKLEFAFFDGVLAASKTYIAWILWFMKFFSRWEASPLSVPAYNENFVREFPAVSFSCVENCISWFSLLFGFFQKVCKLMMLVTSLFMMRLLSFLICRLDIGLM